MYECVCVCVCVVTVVILCQPQAEEGHAFKGVPKGMNLVVVEGGPKGIKKFVSLMLKR